jgi:predicted Fe-Mo cluster-binding NifX family protein
MTIALPLFSSRVSPRFDCAPDVLLVTVDGDRITGRERCSLLGRNPLARVNWLCQRGVDVIICGGISRFSLRSVMNRGLRVFPWVTGDVDDAVRLFLSGQLQPDLVIEPGKTPLRRRRRGKGGGTPWFMG